MKVLSCHITDDGTQVAVVRVGFWFWARTTVVMRVSRVYDDWRESDGTEHWSPKVTRSWESAEMFGHLTTWPGGDNPESAKEARPLAKKKRPSGIAQDGSGLAHRARVSSPTRDSDQPEEAGSGLGDFVVSAAVAAATDSAVIGSLVGGSVAGAVLGDAFDGDLMD